MSVTLAKRLTKMSGWCSPYPGGFASAVEFGMTRRWSSDRAAVELVDRCRGNSREKR